MNVELSPVVLAAGLTVFFLALSIMGVIGIVTRKFSKVGIRVQKASTVEHSSSESLFRHDELSSINWLNSLLGRISFARSINRLLLQADVSLSTSVFFMLSIGAPLCSYLILRELIPLPWGAFLCSVAVAFMPWLWVKMKKDARMAKFLQQLPDALDALGRALRAGHALNSGLGLLAEEYDKPLGQEFEKTLQEINFGISLEKALTNLMERVDLPSLHFFAVSVIIQREVGGNLAELVETISYLIREQYKLLGRVKTLSGEARVSAIIFILLPIGIAAFIFRTNPGYLNLLFSHPQGIFLLKIGLCLMVVGILTMYKMIKIKV